jgi:hypothetical protein
VSFSDVLMITINHLRNSTQSNRKILTFARHSVYCDEFCSSLSARKFMSADVRRVNMWDAFEATRAMLAFKDAGITTAALLLAVGLLNWCADMIGESDSLL